MIIALDTLFEYIADGVTIALVSHGGGCPYFIIQADSYRANIRVTESPLYPWRLRLLQKALTR